MPFPLIPYSGHTGLLSVSCTCQVLSCPWTFALAHPSMCSLSTASGQLILFCSHDALEMSFLAILPKVAPFCSHDALEVSFLAILSELAYSSYCLTHHCVSLVHCGNQVPTQHLLQLNICQMNSSLWHNFPHYKMVACEFRWREGTLLW